MLVILKRLEKYPLVINFERLILDLDLLLNLKLILRVLMEDMMQKIVFSMVIFLTQILLNLT